MKTKKMCKGCDYLKILINGKRCVGVLEGYCYMFRHPPKTQCVQHTKYKKGMVYR